MKDTLNRFIELADKIAANPNEQQKYTGLCKLMVEIKNTIPNTITANAKAIDSDTKLRLNICRYYICHNGFGDHTYREQMGFIKDHYSDIQVWEQETGDQQRERENKLKEYSQITGIEPNVVEIGSWYKPKGASNFVRNIKTEPHPDSIYIQHGIYRQWYDVRNTPYFRLFWQIWQQGNTADFETICEMVCLYIALKNEADFVADELRLIGQLPQPQQPDEPTSTDTKVLPIDFDISDRCLSMYLDKAFGVIPPDEFMGTTFDGRYYTADNIKENSPFERKNLCLKLLCEIRLLTRKLKQTPDPLEREKLKNERGKLYTKYCNIIKPTDTDQPTTATPQPTATPTDTATTPANPLLDNPEFQKILNKAIKAGFVEVTNGGYRWLKYKNELAYFAAKVSDKLHLCHRQNANGQYQISWQPFERLFNENNLKGAENDCKKTGATPKNAKNIDAIIG